MPVNNQPGAVDPDGHVPNGVPTSVRPNVRQKKNTAHPAPSFLQGVIETMARMRAERGRCVIVFTAPNRRAGTSYVVKLLAEELASQCKSTVAVVPTEALKGCDPKHLPQGFVEQSHNLWTAVADQVLEQMPQFALENVWVSPGDHNFDYVLIDCPSLDSSAQALRWAATVDGVILVVQAGVTRIEQIDTAQRLLQTSSGHLAGIVLNRRTYPIPKFLYKIL